MNNIVKKVGLGAATAALFTLSAVPSAFAATTVGTSGNGAFSDNNATVSNDCSSTVDQSSSDWVSNIISLLLGTGGNSASFNTGGSVIVASGNTSASTDITNAGASNVDLMGAMGCNAGGTTAIQGGNGAFSTNSVNVQDSNSNSVKQTAENSVLNNVTEQLSTGNNSADFNTGTNVELLPGSAALQTTVSNLSGSNSLY